MSQTLEIPDKRDANVKTVTLDARTKVEDDEAAEGFRWVREEFQCDLPVTIADAIAVYGEKEVFRKFINAQVVFLQGQKRSEMRPKEEGKERSRAKYLEELGL